MSKTLELMLGEKKGFRSEKYSGSKVRWVDDVIRYEFSMGNVDIIEYLQKEHGILSEYVLEEEQIKELREECSDDSEYEDALNDSFVEMCNENIPYIADEIYNFLIEKFNVGSTNELYALWLSDKDSVYGFYNDESNDGIDEYDLNKELLIISDLDNEGSLFIFRREDMI